MKIDRLLALTNYLLANKRVTAQTLSERFEVSTRTVMRDINTLSLAGIPVVTYYGADGGYEILESYKLDRQLMNESDHTFIITALQALQSAFPEKELDDTLDKVQAIMPDCKTDMVLDFSVLKENSGVNETLIFLQNAINTRQKVTFLYTNAENVEKEHVVEPVVTMYKWYQWYLLCYYPKYDDYRIFKLVRMRKLFLTGEHNTRVHKVAEAMNQWEQAEKQKTCLTAKLQCNNKIRVKCEEYLNGVVTKELDGSFIYECKYHESEHFWYGMILAFGTDIKVLEPPELIQRVQKSCSDILAQYQ